MGAHEELRRSYDRVADEYARRIYDELKDKPLDRMLLDRFAAELRGAGPVADIGCGPGHVARYLCDRGVSVHGIDFSDEMLRVARRLNPDIEFVQGDMAALDVPDEAWAGIACFYAIIHIPRESMTAVLGRFWRALRPGGLMLLTFHIGSETIHRDEWWGHDVNVDTLFFEADEIAGFLSEAGFEIDEVIERDPYPDVEYPSRRAYVFARAPGIVPPGAGT